MFAMAVANAQTYDDEPRRDLKVQAVDQRAHVDTLTWRDRLSLRTNFVDWTLLTPSIGVEWDLGRTNYSRWAVGVNLRGNWNTKHTFKPGVVYNIADVRGELRQYWRPKQIDGREVRPHKTWLGRIFSARHRVVKHPTWAFYRGLYASYTDYSIKLGSEGKQGSALTGGFTWGFIKPLYVFKHGSSLDLEVGISAGVAYAKYDTYRHDRENNCYYVTQSGAWDLVKHPVVSDIRVGLVYRIGKYPSSHKYRWRYDVDVAYADALRAKAQQRERERIDKQTSDSINRLIDRDFEMVYKQRAAENKIAAEKQRALDKQQKRQAKIESRMQKRQQKMEEKAAKEARKAEAKAKRKADKAAKEARKAEDKAKREAEKVALKAAKRAKAADRKEDER